MLIGIDPGASGGIAVMRDNGLVNAVKMPETTTDVCDFIQDTIKNNTDADEQVYITMEKVGGFTGYRKVPVRCSTCGSVIWVKEADPGSAMFKFGKGYGNLEGIIIASRYIKSLHLEEVTPQTWQKVVGAGTRSGVSKHEWKTKLKGMAQKFYPSLRVTLNTADALLILTYARRRRNMI